MKQIILILTSLLLTTTSASSMSYNQARREAFFLTDKMAYELNLTPEQYDAAFEINLDYLMGVTTIDDVYSDYWTRRNLDMSYILLQWQWDAFRAATYFYRPLYWANGFWHFAIYARYPRRDYFYFNRPTVYITYRGGHSWRSNGGHSYYHTYRDKFQKAARTGGLRDRWNKGEFHGNRLNSNTHNQVSADRNNTNKFGNINRGGSFGSTIKKASPTRTTTNGSFRIGSNINNNDKRNSFKTVQPNNNITTKQNIQANPKKQFETIRNRNYFNKFGNSTTASNRPSFKTNNVKMNSSTININKGSFKSVHNNFSTAPRSNNSNQHGAIKTNGFKGKR